jgi:hypothetical protein
MTKSITQLIEEQENKSNLLDTRSPYVKTARALEDSQKIEVSVSDIEEVLPLSLRREYKQCEVTFSLNQNGKRTEMKLTGKKARKLGKKNSKIEKLQQVPKGTSQKETLQN